MTDRPSGWTNNDEQPSLAHPAEPLPPPPPGLTPHRRPRWRRLVLVLAGVAAVGLGYLTGSGYFTDAIEDQGLDNSLINVDFRDSLDGFKTPAVFGAAWDLAAGRYRVTVTGRVPSLHSSVAKFARPASGAGITAEVIRITKPGTFVGAGCLDATNNYFFGYFFLVEPGGNFAFFRQDRSSGEILSRGTTSRIRYVDRVSIMCVPSSSGTVTLVGFANRLELARVRDPGGYDKYSLTGLAVATDHVGTQVWFTGVSAQIPDEAWTP